VRRDVKKNEDEEGREEKKDIPDHNMSCRFFKMIEKEADGKNPGLGLKGAQGEPVNLEAELGKNFRDKPACLMGWLHSPCGGEAEKRHQDPTHDRSVGNFYPYTAAGQAGYLVHRVHYTERNQAG
jgi:hypothetical protein